MPVVNAFATDRDVSRGKDDVFYGLRSTERFFAMFGRGKVVAKAPKNGVDELVNRARLSASILVTEG